MALRNGSKCSYTKCTNYSTTHKNLSFFRFPVKSDERCTDWIVNSGNDDFSELSDKQLRCRYLCSEHFEDSAFYNSLRSKLIKNSPLAIPRPYFRTIENCVDPPSEPLIGNEHREKQNEDCSLNCEEKENEDTSAKEERESLEQFSKDFAPLPETPDALKAKESPTPRKKKMIGLITRQKKKLKKKSNQISFIKKRTTPNRSLVDLDSIVKVLPKFISGEPLCFIKMQLIHQKRAKWTEEEKNIALSLYYKSPSTYKFLREWGFKLPCITLIQKWVNVHNIKPGFSNEVFDKVKMKAATMTPEEKECVLMCDEMSIRKALKYNTKLDLVEGYEDLGPLGRNDKEATHAMVFMLRGLKHSWKCPVAYVVSNNSVKTASLAILMDLCIDRVFDSNLNLKAVVSDQGSNNAAVMRLMGATPETPYIMFGDKKVFCLFDVPHLLKSVRNNLLKHDITIKEETVSWTAIWEFYELDKSSNTDCRAAPKLSERHLSPQPFHKMIVKLATQVLSGAVSRGMKAANSLGLLKNKSSLSTANFLAKMNDITDCLNSKYLNEKNPMKKPMSSKNPAIKQCLEEAVEFVQSWSIKDQKNPPCFSGLVQSIQAVLQLYTDVVKDDKGFLLTSRLNQDPIENLFGVLRRRSGHNDNPSAKEFRRNLQHSLSIRLMNPPESANCEPDNDENLPIGENLPCDPNLTPILTEFEPEALVSQLEFQPEGFQDPPSTLVDPPCASTSNNITTLHSLEDNVVCYIAGWLAKRCNDKFACKNCFNDLMKKETVATLSREHLIYFKTFTKHTGELAKLNKPTDTFHHVVQIQIIAFANLYTQLCSAKNLKETLTKKIAFETEKVYSDWWKSECKVHRQFMLDLLVKCKLFNSFRWKSTELRDRALIKKRTATNRQETNDCKLQRKLKKLKHV